MFSSPAIRVYSSENVDNQVQRKPGTIVSARKPLLDKPVNSKIADINKFKLNAELCKETNTFEKQKTVENEFDMSEFTFSHEDDSFEDIDPCQYQNKQFAFDILRSYAGCYETPPPSPKADKYDKIDPIFFEVPTSDYLKLSPEIVAEEYCWNDDLDVEIPTCDSDEFDDTM